MDERHKEILDSLPPIPLKKERRWPVIDDCRSVFAIRWGSLSEQIMGREASWSIGRLRGGGKRGRPYEYSR